MRSTNGVKSFWRWAIGLAIVLGSAAAAQTLGAQGMTLTAQQDALRGTYSYAATADQETAMRNSIAAATASLADDARSLWRQKLAMITMPAPELGLNRASREISIDGGGTALRSKDDGTAKAVAGGWQVKQQFSGTTLVQLISNSELTQEYRYQLGTNGSTLTLGARITSALFSQAIEYKLTYRRQ
jgi:hypothetical protein